MNRMMLLGGTALLAVGCTGTARAQTLLLDCYKVKGEVVACQSSSSDGKTVAGADFSLYSGTNTKLGSGKTDEHGVYIFKAPPQDYDVVVSAGPAHVTSLSSPDISTRPQRPGWGGDWVPVAAVDRLDKLQQWQAQFTSERPPLVEKIEQDLAK